MFLSMEFPKSSRMEWVMKIRTTWWFRANLEIFTPPGFKIVAIIPADHHFELELDGQCSFNSTCWTEVGSKRQKLDEPPAAWLSFKRQLIIWNCATSKYIKILDVNIPGAMPCLLPHQKPWTCWGNQRIFKQCSTDSCKCFSTLALVAKGIVYCSSMLSNFLVGSLSTPIASGWMLS